MKRRAACIALLATLSAMAASARAQPGMEELLLAAGGTDGVRGSGQVVEEQRALAGYSAIRMRGPVDVELRASDRESVVVRADDNVLELVETKVVPGERPALEIGLRPSIRIRSRRAPLVVVEFRALSELVVSGSGDVRADRIGADDFALSIRGSGDVHIRELDARLFAAVLSGSGDLRIDGGQADQQAYRLSGSGDVNAGRLTGRAVQVAVTGSGDAVVHATESLHVTIGGSGDVAYRGTPRVSQRVNGSGRVRAAR